VVAPAISGGGGGSDDLLIQDLHDTLKSNTLQASENDDSLDNMDDDPVIDSEGLASLGGGVFVGITATLLNAQIAFEANYTPEQTGAATANDVGGVSLTDASALFITNGVQRGAVIVNFTDQSVCEVLRVNSETQLDHRVLQQGAANDWTIGDAYKIWNVVQKEVSGGNLVGLDALDAELSPIFPTAFTQVVRTLASSATLQELDDVRAQSFVDATVYIDTVNGSAGTVFPKGTPSDPVDNFSDAKAIADFWNYSKYDLHGPMALSAAESIVSSQWHSHAISHSTITLVSGVNTLDAVFREAVISGVFNGTVHLEDCWIGTSTGFWGTMDKCAFTGDITLDSACTSTLNIDYCRSHVAGVSRPTLDLNGADIDVNIRGYIGGLTFAGLTQARNVSIDVLSGTIEIDASCTAGTIVVRGTGAPIIDNSGAGCTVNTDGFHQYDGDLDGQFVEGIISTRGALRAILAAVGGKSDGFSDVVGDIVAHYRDQADTKDRITVTVDEFGNRKAVTFDLT
jgi:hypothetical protein